VTGNETKVPCRFSCKRSFVCLSFAQKAAQQPLEIRSQCKTRISTVTFADRENARGRESGGSRASLATYWIESEQRSSGGEVCETVPCADEALRLDGRGRLRQALTH